MLSVIILTHNVEDIIDRCIEAIRDADEIIVVDDYSQDRTLDICKRYTDKVFLRHLQDDFAGQRNFALSKAEGDWVLNLDADEYVPPTTFSKIKEIVAQEYPQFRCYAFRRKNIFLQDLSKHKGIEQGHYMQYGGWQEEYCAKLFYKEGAYFIGSVHEEVVFPGRLARLNLYIEHYPFRTISECLQKLDHYTTLDAAREALDSSKIGKKRLYYNIKIKPLKIFYKIYIKKKGYKDGIYGFIFSIMWALGYMVKWIKVLERRGII